MSYRTPSDKAPAATARDALVRATERYSALARVWHDSRPTHTLPFERCVWSECQIERHDALIAALAADAEAPGRVAALEAEPCHATMLCPYPQDHPIHAEDGDHDYAPAPTPSEPVARFTGQDEWPCVCGHVKRRHHFGDTPAIDGSFGAWCQADPMHCVRFTPGARDE